MVDQRSDWYKFVGKNGVVRELTLKQRRAILNYVDPESATYSSWLGSFKEAYGMESSPEVIAVEARVMKRKKHIQGAIETLLEDNGFGIGERVRVLADIGKGTATYTKEELSREGEVVELEVKPSFGERLKAVELANKVDGTYAKVEAAKELAMDEHRALRNKLVKDLADNK